MMNGVTSLVNEPGEKILSMGGSNGRNKDVLSPKIPHYKTLSNYENCTEVFIGSPNK